MINPLHLFSEEVITQEFLIAHLLSFQHLLKSLIKVLDQLSPPNGLEPQLPAHHHVLGKHGCLFSC